MGWLFLGDWGGGCKMMSGGWEGRRARAEEGEERGERGEDQKVEVDGRVRCGGGKEGGKRGRVERTRATHGVDTLQPRIPQYIKRHAPSALDASVHHPVPRVREAEILFLNRELLVPDRETDDG